MKSSRWSCTSISSVGLPLDIEGTKKEIQVREEREGGRGRAYSSRSGPGIINIPWTHNERLCDAVCLFSDGSYPASGLSAVSLFSQAPRPPAAFPFLPFLFWTHTTHARMHRIVPRMSRWILFPEATVFLSIRPFYNRLPKCTLWKDIYFMCVKHDES